VCEAADDAIGLDGLLGLLESAGNPEAEADSVDGVSGTGVDKLGVRLEEDEVCEMVAAWEECGVSCFLGHAQCVTQSPAQA
jgi:hypothetical protein